MKTIGEKRVRVEFNPDANGVVDEIKMKTAELINDCEGMKTYESERQFDNITRKVLKNHPEQLRLISLAQTAYEEAAMWAVKAATYK